MPRRAACHQHGVSQLHLLAILQAVVHLGRRELRVVPFAHARFRRTTPLHHIGVLIHHIIFRTRELEDFRAAGAVIRMRMADEQDSDVGEFKTQLFHAFTNQRH